VRQQHHGIQHLIEMGAALCSLAVVGPHAAPAVEKQQNALIPLVLELAYDWLTQPLGGPPVDMPHAASAPVLAHFLEIGPLTALLKSLAADFLQPIAACEPGIPGNLRKVRIYTPSIQAAEPF